MVEKMLARFKFYGIKVQVESDNQFVIESLIRDFSFFISDFKKPDIKIHSRLGEIDYSNLPKFDATSYKKNSIVFGKGDEIIVDYRGHAVTHYDFKKEKGEITSQDQNRLYEISYLLLMSRVGELLDEQGIHRIHGVGISFHGQGLLFLLPEGGGKSTLMLSLFQNESVKILGDDTPLIENKMMLCFPTRVGLSKEDSIKIPQKFKRIFHRTGLGEKTLVDIEYFGDRICKKSSVNKLIICNRTLSKNPKLKKVSRLRGLKPIFRDMVFGLGIPQLVEYFLRGTSSDSIAKARIFLKRSFVGVKLVLSTEVFEFDLSQDRKKNNQILLEKMLK